MFTRYDNIAKLCELKGTTPQDYASMTDELIEWMLIQAFRNRYDIRNLNWFGFS